MMKPIWKRNKKIEIIYDSETDIFHIHDHDVYIEVDLNHPDPKSKYSLPHWLEMCAEARLRADIASQEKPRQYQRALGVLFDGQLDKRRSREVPAKEGVVDDIITQSSSPDGQRFYNRSHPEGRKVNTDEQRKEQGAPYYGG